MGLGKVLKSFNEEMCFSKGSALWTWVAVVDHRDVILFLSNRNHGAPPHTQKVPQATCGQLPLTNIQRDCVRWARLNGRAERSWWERGQKGSESTEEWGEDNSDPLLQQ